MMVKNKVLYYFNKRLIPILIFSILFVFLLSSCSSQKSESTQKFIIPIGIILPLTGSGSDQGQWLLNALELAKEDLRKQGINVELLYQDSKGGNPTEAVTAYKAITQLNKIPVVITWGSSVGLALTPLVNQDKIVQMGVATATPKYATLHDFAFRIFPSAEWEGRFNAQLLQRMNIQKVAIVYTNNDYGVAQRDAFTKEFESSGGAVLIAEPLNPTDTDFTAQVLKVRSVNPEKIFMAVYPKEGALFLKQLREGGVNANVIASSAFIGGDIFKVAGVAAEGMKISMQKFDTNSSNPITQHFVSEYSAKYSSVPDVYATRGYDALFMIIPLIQSCEKQQSIDKIDNLGDCLLNSLETMPPYPSITGVSYSFDENGDIATPEFEIKTVINGKLVSGESYSKS